MWVDLSKSDTIQIKSDETAQLLNKPYVNEVTLRGQNICLKCYQPLEIMLYLEKGFISFHTGNIGSVGQRAAKLLSIKI